MSNILLPGRGVSTQPIPRMAHVAFANSPTMVAVLCLKHEQPLLIAMVTGGLRDYQLFIRREE